MVTANKKGGSCQKITFTIASVVMVLFGNMCIGAGKFGVVLHDRGILSLSCRKF